MAKRGRPPKAEADRKSKPVSIRLTPALWARLEEERATAEPARTLSQEVELRLWQSLELEHQIEKRFFGKQNYLLMQIIADGFNWIEFVTQQRIWQEPYAFDEAKIFISALLRYLRPKGRGKVPALPLLPPFTGRPKGELGRRAATGQIAVHQMEALGTLEHFGSEHDPVLLRIQAAAFFIAALVGKSGKSALRDLYQNAPINQETKK